jgi:hypothetical protein
MGLWLKQSTAVDVIVGPFIDDTDGKTAETGLTVTQAEVRLSKNGGNIAQKNEATSLVHDELGYYVCKFDTTDTNTLGVLQLMIHESGALPVYHEYMVVTANVWDTLCSTDVLQADLTQMGGVAQSATDLKDFADAGYDPANDKITGIVATGIDDILDEVVEGTYTVRQYLRLFAAALLGKVSGGGTTTNTFRDTADGTDRITATVDSDGNRTAMTLDAT